MTRINFSAKTRKLVAGRAGDRCSYPTCGRHTSGPGAKATELSGTGCASHIYSAASKGPRGQGGLTSEELSSSSNAIWLCAQHARLVDNNRGDKYPPERLVFYKQLHEARIAQEHEGLYPAIGWLFELAVNESPIFGHPSCIRFNKLTLLIGDNGTGKTALCEWLRSLLDPASLKRWGRSTNSPWDVTFRYLCPQEMTTRIQLIEGKLLYWINAHEYAFNPVRFNVIAPDRELGRRSSVRTDGPDDLEYLSNIFSEEPDAIILLARKIGTFPYSHVHNLHFEQDEGRTNLLLDLKGRREAGIPFRALSGSEQDAVLVEFATAIARERSAFMPTFLILDSLTSYISNEWFDRFTHHFLDPQNQFQTLITIPDTRQLDLNTIQWNGWEVVKLSGYPPSVQIDQRQD